MPYIITTKREGAWNGPMGYQKGYAPSRRAVATLEETRGVLLEKFRHYEGYLAHRPWAENLPESGGTVGPLPDGTVIEVAWVDEMDLAHEARVTFAQPASEIVDAYNKLPIGAPTRGRRIP